MNQLSENVKSQFISQYYGQRIWCIDGLAQVQLINGYTLFKYIKSEDEFLLLRKVEQLTDEELMIVALILHSYSVIPPNQLNTKMVDDAKFYLSKLFKNFSMSAIVVSRLNQYLLRIGILLPFVYLQDGKPHTLTVEQIVEMGWARIKE